MVIAPIGKTWVIARRSASFKIKLVTAGLSLTGEVLGIQQIAVNPPTAAASEPDRIVSSSSLPGSRR